MTEKTFSDTLLINNSNKIIASLQNIVLRSQSYGQAADQCCEIDKEQVRSADGVNLIANAVYKCNFKSVASEAFDGFGALLNSCRGQKQSMKSFQENALPLYPSLIIFCRRQTFCSASLLWCG